MNEWILTVSDMSQCALIALVSCWNCGQSQFRWIAVFGLQKSMKSRLTKIRLIGPSGGHEIGSSSSGIIVILRVGLFTASAKLTSLLSTMLYCYQCKKFISWHIVRAAYVIPLKQQNTHWVQPCDVPNSRCAVTTQSAILNICSRSMAIWLLLFYATCHATLDDS